ncbi:MAG: 5'-nucleotidase C-terminal domain-containing protein [Solobacterium sp.]|nr:5'-nucleotidase C-terminal domain-containing protein [Solobacterium sp.]
MNERRKITILATSDLHGKLYPWDYVQKKEDLSGSMMQLAGAVKELYDPNNTLLVDAGDTIQDNCAELFLMDDINPLMNALNDMGYELWTTGNHEYDFGMDIVKKTIASFSGHVVLGNVFDSKGQRIAEPYAIFEKDGIRIAVVSMVTPLIKRWEGNRMDGYDVTDPIEETGKILKELEGKYDLLLGVHHMGIKDELNTNGTGMESYLPHFPQYDAVVSSHEHQLIVNQEINGVLTVQNKNNAKTMIRLDFELERTDEGWNVIGKNSECIDISTYQPDAEFMERYRSCHGRLLEDAGSVIGELEGESLAEENEIEVIPTPQIKPTALISLINKISRYYSDAPVSCTLLCKNETNLSPGPITKSDAASLYIYTNTLNKVRMTGRQLKRFLEWEVSYYNTWHPGDLTISFNKDMHIYNLDIFSGIYYEINLAKEVNNRIENLTWPDGTPIKDEDEFDLAVNGYRYGSSFTSYGEVFTEKEGLPELIESDIHSEMGGIQGMIRDYIETVLHGYVVPETENNWKITGIDWDEELYQKAVELIRNGKIDLSLLEDGGNPNGRSLTEEEVRAALEQENGTD